MQATVWKTLQADWTRGPPSCTPPPCPFTLVDAICCARYDIVHLVGHAAALGHKPHAAGAVQLAGDNVVQRARSVANLEGARLWQGRGCGAGGVCGSELRAGGAGRGGGWRCGVDEHLRVEVLVGGVSMTPRSQIPVPTFGPTPTHPTCMSTCCNGTNDNVAPAPPRPTQTPTPIHASTPPARPPLWRAQ